MAEVAENGRIELSCLGGQLQVDEVLVLVSSAGGQEAEPVHMRVERTLGEGERLVLEGES
jgi:hypothetical protein